MITLYQGPRVWGLPNMSPYCTKVEMYLRVTKTPYTTDRWRIQNAPNKKMPYIRDAEGRIIGDSHKIIQHLQHENGYNIDDQLDEKVRHQAHLIRRLVEDSLFWVGLYTRWVEPNGLAAVKDVFDSLLPAVKAGVFFYGFRWRMRRDLWGQGISRRSPSEVYEIGVADLNVLADFLQGKQYALGDRVTTLDCTIYPFLLALLKTPFDNPVKTAGQSREPLTRYMKAISTEFFSDYPALTTG